MSLPGLFELVLKNVFILTLNIAGLDIAQSRKIQARRVGQKPLRLGCDAIWHSI